MNNKKIEELTLGMRNIFKLIKNILLLEIFIQFIEREGANALEN